MEWIATAAYGLEGVLAQELRDLGLEVGLVQTSRVAFSGTPLDGCRANLHLRTAGHVRLVVGRFSAATFDGLFEGVRALPWADYLPQDAAFPVTARCITSQLMSVPDCQAIVKKAIVEKLRQTYRQSWFPEKGPLFPVEVHLWKDEATLSIDTSGTPLHQRGYRKLNGPAALRETLAAALVLLSHWHEDRMLWDPCCGTGTIAIEAALLGRRLAPGLERTFGAEAWPWWDAADWREARKQAWALARPDAKLDIIASDVDPEALSMAGYHVKAAHVADTIDLRCLDVKDVRSNRGYGHLITNPPYGVRMGDRKATLSLAQTLGQVYRRLGTWSCHVITADQGFERAFGARASKRRALYNGQLACRYYQFFGPRPPRRDEAHDES